MSDFLRDNAYSAHDVTEKIREHIEKLNEIDADLETKGNQIDTLEKNGIDIKRYEPFTVGSDWKNAIEEAITDSSTTKAPIILSVGTFNVSSLNVENVSGITIRGTSKTGSILKITESYNNKVSFNGCNNIVFENMTIELDDGVTTDKFRFGDSSTINGCSDIAFRNCIFKNTENTKTDSGTVTFWRNCYNIEFSKCIFNDIHRPIKFDNNGVDVSRGIVRIEKCDFLGDTTLRAKKAIRFMGTGSRYMTYCFIQDNMFERFDEGAFELYHVMAWTVTGNTFQDCKALTDDYTGDSPVERAICWLDAIGTPPSGSSIFANNTFTDCVGICIYLEEVRRGIIEGNKFSNITKRPSGVRSYTNGTYTISSYGSHCIVAVGGVEDLMIRGNNFCDVDRLLLVCRKFSPVIIGGYYIEFIMFTGNKVRNCRETAIDIKERTQHVVVRDNPQVIGVGNAYPFIEYEKPDATQDLSYLTCDNNNVRGFSTMYKRDANYGNGQFLNNYFYGDVASTFFQCNFRTNYAINNNVHATSQTAFTIVNS